jgi:steroid delta-isomerase-like uncharacterized protein
MTMLRTPAIVLTASVAVLIALPGRPLGATQGKAPPASTEISRQLALRYYNEMWARLDPNAADALVATDVVGHVDGRTLTGVATLKARVKQIARMYAPTRFTVDAVVAEGDHAVVRWTQHGTHTGVAFGAGTKGKAITVTGMNMFRIANGRIAELWVNADDLGERAQLGLAQR